MKYVLRDYQQQAVDAGVHFFNDKERYNGIIVVSTGGGKSLIISELANRLDDNVLVFQPTKEILEQNLKKMKTYTDDCSAYSASVGQKRISKITFAMIGSVKTKVEDFKHFKYVLIDECHLVNGEKGMYLDFLRQLDCKVLGLTATPFRLYSDTEFDVSTRTMRTTNSRLVMLTNDENKFFDRIIYKVQVKDLLDRGFLAKVQYYDCRPKGWNEARIYKNSTGSDFSANSVQWMMEQTDHLHHLVKICRHLLALGRNRILVFVQFIEDAQELCTLVGDSEYLTGETTKRNRERIIEEFTSGKLKILVNVTCLSTGFDYPALDTVVLGRPTLSLSLYYQMLGRILRPYEGKDAWCIDTVGNVNRFGYAENLRLERAKATGLEEMFGYVWDYDERRMKWKALTSK